MENTATTPAHCEACGSLLDPWNFGMPQADALDHQLAEVRHRAALKVTLDRYPSLLLRERICLAMEILYDVLNTWDHDNLEHYPESMPSFDEYLYEIGQKLYDIHWTKDEKPRYFKRPPPRRQP